MLRLCIPLPSGRGAGLGNELIPWARAFIAAQVLGAKALPPAFGLNPRRYGRHFDTPRYDWLLHAAARVLLPVFEFGEREYQAHGGGDAMLSFRRFAEHEGLFTRRVYCVVTQGMWGGFEHVAAARDFVLATLHHSRFAARNLMRLRERLSPGRFTVGMHVRLGDFQQAASPESYTGSFNRALPLAWYLGVAASAVRHLGDNVQFVVASDGTAEQLKPLTERFPCIVSSALPDADCSDLLALTQSHLLVCSISSFSAWAAFLSPSPYLWYAPQLWPSEGWGSIWGHEPLQKHPQSPTAAALASWRTGDKLTPRGWAVGPGGHVPAAVFDAVIARGVDRFGPREADLVRYGVSPLATSVSNDFRQPTEHTA